MESRSMRSFIFLTLGSLTFACLKFVSVSLIHHFTFFPLYANYASVALALLVIGWVYHSKISFQLPLTLETFWRYMQQAFFLKILDYALFNVWAYGLGLSIFWSVVLTSGVVFTIRVVAYFKYVFVAE